MPSHLHEALLLLFRNRPELAPELLRDALHLKLPPYSEASIDEAQAEADPELAVLSAMAHGRDVDPGKSARIAAAAQLASVRLDADRARLYFDLVMHSLSEAARRALQTMNPAKYEYQSDFAKFYIAQGGAQGRAAVVSRQLTLRFGPLPTDVQNKIAAASSPELDAIAERLLTAQTLIEALGESA